VNYFARTISPVNNWGGAQQVIIHAFGFGGVSAISDAYFLNYTSNPITIGPANRAILLVIDGVINFAYQLAGNTITLNPPPRTGAEMAIVIYDGGPIDATQVTTEAVAASSLVTGHTWPVGARDVQTFPEFRIALQRYPYSLKEIVERTRALIA